MHGYWQAEKREEHKQQRFCAEKKKRESTQRSGSMLVRHPKTSKLLLFALCSSQKEPVKSMVMG
jgi:hypothetical protein